MKNNIQQAFDNFLAEANEKAYMNDDYKNGYHQGIEDVRCVFKQTDKTVDQIRIALLRKRETLSNHMLQKTIDKEDGWLDSDEHHFTLGTHDCIGDAFDSLRDVND